MRRIKSEITIPNKKVLLLVLSVTLIVQNSFAQHQRADYKIDCTLNDQTHSLAASMVITYHNNSDKDLLELKIHTWMNVFSAKKSEYATQMARLGDGKKYKLNKMDQGGYKKLTFSSQNEILQYNYENESKEILSLQLKRQLKARDSVIIHCNFILDIPKNISRGGRLNQTYQLTQWYPKLALFDSTGWNTMNYLELGEYFNDFGNYEVSISLPSTYKLAATGILTNEEERSKMISYSKHSEDSTTGNKTKINESASEIKTLKYIANNVIDFAWFADKEYWIGHDTVMLNNRTIDVWSFYRPGKQNIWKGAISYSKKAIKYLSEKIGEYPYPQVTIVECERPASDAMEYPMIALIDKGYNSSPIELEKVIVHEIAHNWFQAILASNERKEAWLDEGLVSYFEKDYFRGSYFSNFLSDAPTPYLTDYDKADDFPWYLQARANKDIAAAASINNFSLMGYVQSIYEKPAKGLKLLNKVMGDSLFNYQFHQYYTKWKFSHPSSTDFFNQISSDSIWYKNLYIASNKKIDLKLTSNKEYLFISHDQEYTIPIEIEAYKKGNKVWSSIKYIAKKDSIKMDLEVQDYVIADPNFLLPEINRLNNISRIRPTPYAPKKIAFRLIPGIGHSLTKDRFIHPMIGFNAHDRFFTGVAIHNFTLPAPSTLAGMILGYSFKTKRPIIQSGISHTISIQNRRINSITPELEFRTFSNGDQIADIVKQYYYKISPKVTVNFTTKSQLSSEKNISFRSVFINQIKKYRSAGNFNEKYAIHEIQFTDINAKHLFPHHWRSVFEFNSKYININTSYHIDIPYKYGRKTYGEIRFFAGIQNNSGNRFNSSFSLSGTASSNNIGNDYKYDELLLGRSTLNTKLNQQIFSKDGGFYTSSSAGWSDSWLIAASFRSKFFNFIPIRPYFQLALSPNNSNRSVTFNYSSGLSLVILRKMVEINFPVIESKSIRSGYTDYQLNRYLRTCTFLIDLKNLNPMKWVTTFTK